MKTQPGGAIGLLVVDDEANMCEMLATLLSGRGYEVATAQSGAEGLARLADDPAIRLVLCDLKMPGMDGLAFLRALAEVEEGRRPLVIVMSAYATIESAVEAMRLGAFDVISKPFLPDEIVLALEKGVETLRLRRENEELRQRLDAIRGEESFGDLLVAGKAMRRVADMARRAARYKATVLITGESGTGKELLARALHHEGERRDGPFVAVNCASVPEGLMESEFFGHVRGAFTGADRDRPGLFLAADRGTLFLDEVAELPPSMQAKLLRVLQEEEVRPVGATASRPVDVRIVAATAARLEDAVARGRFREDLFYRLNVVRLHLPPLRERLDELPHLVDHFLRKLNAKHGLDLQAVSSKAMSRLLAYHWPGNVRELENVLERAAVLTDKRIILPEHLPEPLGLPGPVPERRLDDLLGTLSLKKAKAIMERRLIRRALEATGGNKTKAARLLELSYPSLLAKIKEYGLDGGGERL